MSSVNLGTEVAYTRAPREGYRMSQEEQGAIYMGLKKKSKEIQTEMAALEAKIRKEGQDFSQLGAWLQALNVKKPDLETYTSLMAGLSGQISRYCDLANQKAELDTQIAKFGLD